MLYLICFFPEQYNGGNNDGDPPLSIPNREVKPISADGTAIPSGRVGSRQFIKSVVEGVLPTALFSFIGLRHLNLNKNCKDCRNSLNSFHLRRFAENSSAFRCSEKQEHLNSAKMQI